MKKSVLMLVLAMMLCFAEVGVTPVHADATPTITVETVESTAGAQNVAVKVSLTDNPGIIAAKLKITYPADMLELQYVEDTELLSGWATKPNYEDDNPAVFAWEDGLATENNTASGTILVLVFYVKAESGEGIAEITLTAEEDDIYNSDLEKVSFATVNGGIRLVSTSHVDADGTWETDATKHWHTCQCSEKFDEGNHADEKVIKNAKDASCKEEGYTGDIYCKVCGVKLENGKMTEKKPHDVAQWTVTKEATAQSAGEKTGNCTACRETVVVATAKLGEEVETESTIITTADPERRDAVKQKENDNMQELWLIAGVLFVVFGVCLYFLYRKRGE